MVFPSSEVAGLYHVSRNAAFPPSRRMGPSGAWVRYLHLRSKGYQVRDETDNTKVLTHLLVQLGLVIP